MGSCDSTVETTKTLYECKLEAVEVGMMELAPWCWRGSSRRGGGSGGDEMLVEREVMVVADSWIGFQRRTTDSVQNLQK